MLIGVIGVDLVSQPTSQQVVSVKNVGKMLSGQNVERMLI